MLCLNVWLTAKIEGDAPRVRELLTEAGRLSRQEPGCLRFEVYQSRQDPKKFLLCEHWTSTDAHAVHRTAQAYTTIYQPQVIPLVEREGHPCDLCE